jgi:hypothetical protein
MKTIAYLASAVLIACSTAGCVQDHPSDELQPNRQSGSAPDAPPVPGDLANVFRVSELVRAAGEGALLQDLAATGCFDAVTREFRRGAAKDLAFGVYAIEDVGDAQARLLDSADALGFAAARPSPSLTGDQLSIVQGDLELRVDPESGSERFVNRAAFHRGEDAKALLPEGDYVARASSHAMSALPHVRAQRAYPYKLRRYMNASAEEGQAVPTTAPYQVAVAFNTTVDDLPVIGPGGKVAVHMRPDGEVISHESSARAVSARLAVVRGADLLSPEAAEQIVERRLSDRGVDLSRYILVRSEFGYFRLGRSSVQSILAPHYAFVYEPAEGTYGKKQFEVIPAVVDQDVLDRIAADNDAERARKDLLKAGASREPTLKPQ